MLLWSYTRAVAVGAGAGVGVVGGVETLGGLAVPASYACSTDTIVWYIGEEEEGVYGDGMGRCSVAADACCGGGCN
jgi:hypothetical protein